MQSPNTRILLERMKTAPGRKTPVHTVEVSNDELEDSIDRKSDDEEKSSEKSEKKIDDGVDDVDTNLDDTLFSQKLPSLMSFLQSTSFSSAPEPKGVKLMNIAVVHPRLYALAGGFDPDYFATPLFPVDTIIDPVSHAFRPHWRPIICGRIRNSIESLGQGYEIPYDELEYIKESVPRDLSGVDMRSAKICGWRFGFNDLRDFLEETPGPNTIYIRLNPTANIAMTSVINRLYPISSNPSTDDSHRSDLMTPIDDPAAN